MDVRASDTSGLAAKRLEFEHTQPIKEKRGFMHDRIATHTAAEADGQISRPKPPRDPREEQSRHHTGDEVVEYAELEEGTFSETASISTGEQHIIDVKV